MKKQTERTGQTGRTGAGTTAICILVALTTVCHAQSSGESQEETRRISQALIGDWEGINEWDFRMEIRIESITESAKIAGALCWKTPGGIIRGGRLDGRTRLMSQGRILSARFGKSWFIARVKDADMLTLLEKREADGEKRRTETAMKRTETVECAHRFASQASESKPAISSRAGGIIGYWIGRRPDESVMEMEISSIGRNGKTRGRKCLRDHATQTIQLDDLSESGRLDATWSTKHRELITQSKQAIGSIQRNTYALKDPNTIHMTAVDHIGTEDEAIERLTMIRDFDPDGCLAWTRPSKRR